MSRRGQPGLRLILLVAVPLVAISGGLKEGDQLILTKPLGSGAILAAWMRGDCRATWFDELVKFLVTPNRDAGLIFDELGVTGCTDVTGFGLAGHLLEMLDASGLSAPWSFCFACSAKSGFVHHANAALVARPLPPNKHLVAIHVQSLLCVLC